MNKKEAREIVKFINDNGITTGTALVALSKVYPCLFDITLYELGYKKVV